MAEGCGWRTLGWLDRWWAVVALVAGLLVARVVWAVWWSPFTLIEDEAHYWEWSRRLGLSYYSKGPGVAWVIALSEWVFRSAAPSAEWVVRVPAAVLSAAGAVGAAGLAWDVFRDRRVVFLSVLAQQSMPAAAVTAGLMTIDGPLIACWSIGAWLGWRALRGGGAWWWAGLGLAVGAGFVFKYTMALLPVGLLVFALVRRGEAAREGARAGFGRVALCAVCALLGLLPVVVWNAQHGWATVRHLLGHLGAAGGDVAGSEESWTPLWALEFFAYQLAIAGPAGVLGVLGLVNLRRFGGGAAGERVARGGATYMVCCGAPVLAMYFVVSLVAQTEANWAIAGWVALAPAAGWAALDGFARRDGPVRFAANACVVALAVLTAGPMAVGGLAERGVLPEGARLAVKRSLGMRGFAGSVGGAMERLRAGTGREPFVAAVHYGRASQMAFYLEGQPTVYAASHALGTGRKTQYDVWAETDLLRPETAERLRGRPAVLLGGSLDAWAGVFERVEGLGRLEHEPKADRESFLGYGFRGFGGLDGAAAGPSRGGGG